MFFTYLSSVLKLQKLRKDITMRVSTHWSGSWLQPPKKKVIGVLLGDHITGSDGAPSASQATGSQLLCLWFILAGIQKMIPCDANVGKSQSQWEFL
jgi:hypothetical protein